MKTADCRPGRSGIRARWRLRAAMHPADTTYLYFVANTQGGHFFASTLAEHNKNVAKYHRLLNGEPAVPAPVEADHTHATKKSGKGRG